MQSDDDRRKKKAAALSYDHLGGKLPQLVAKGQGYMAERIIDAAKENGVAIREDPDLLEMLCKLEVNQFIPEKMFGAVAEVMAYVYRLNNRQIETERDRR